MRTLTASSDQKAPASFGAPSPGVLATIPFKQKAGYPPPYKVTSALHPHFAKHDLMCLHKAPPTLFHYSGRQTRGLLLQVKAFVELAGSLLSAGAAKSQAGQPTGLSGEMLRCMRSSGVINALIGALKLVDMDHPNVRPTASLSPSSASIHALLPVHD